MGDDVSVQPSGTERFGADAAGTAANMTGVRPLGRADWRSTADEGGRLGGLWKSE